MTEMVLMKIGPNEAADLLAKNGHNRRVSHHAVAQYAADMAAGRWREATAEPIAIDTNGVLQEGQHRLLAIQRSGSTLSMWVAIGTDPDDFHWIGQGKSRSAADVLGIQGHTQTKQLASIAKAIINLRRNGDRLWHGSTGRGAQGGITRQEVIEFVEENSDGLRFAVDQIGSQLFRETRIYRTAYATVAFEVFTNSDAIDLWAQWHTSVITGEMLRQDDPVFVLRRYAMKWDRDKSGSTAMQQQWIAVISKAWNAYVADKPMRILYWRRNELPMPEIAKSVAL